MLWALSSWSPWTRVVQPSKAPYLCCRWKGQKGRRVCVGLEGSLEGIPCSHQHQQSDHHQPQGIVGIAECVCIVMPAYYFEKLGFPPLFINWQKDKQHLAVLISCPVLFAEHWINNFVFHLHLISLLNFYSPSRSLLLFQHKQWVMSSLRLVISSGPRWEHILGGPAWCQVIRTLRFIPKLTQEVSSSDSWAGLMETCCEWLFNTVFL